MRRTLGPGVLALAFSAFATSFAASSQGDPCQFDAVCRFLEQNIGLKPPLTLTTVRRFMKVDRETESRVDNLHVPGQTDTIHELTSAGLTLRLYASASGPVLLQRIDLTTNRYPLPLDLVFGRSTLDDVQHVLGLPKSVEHLPDGTSRWRYDNVEGTASCTFAFDPEPSLRIRSVQWQFDVD